MTATTSPSPPARPSVGAEHAWEPSATAGDHELRRRLWRWAGDGVALLLLSGAFWYLADHDGGRNLAEFLPVAWITAAFIPWTLGELRRLPRAGVTLIAAFAAGAMASTAFGTVRAGFEGTAVIFVTTVLFGLAVHRIWRREWAPPVLLILIIVSAGLYWQRSFMQWWGAAGTSGSRWLALSWHNQSGTLMASFGVFGLGVALIGRRLLVPVGLLMVAGGFAGAWLSGSRGALAASIAALGVAVAVGIRERGLARTLLISVAGVAATVAVVGWLSFVRSDVAPADPSSAITEDASQELRQPLLERDGDAGTNAFLRLRHIEAALGMFVDRPLTGHGLGSYRTVSLRWSSPDANLTSYAHNRYAQSLGEGGLVLGVPLLGLLGATGVLVWRRIVRDPSTDDQSLIGRTDPGWRRAVTGGLATSGVLIAAHSMVDFDWSFPILPLLLATGCATLAVDHASAKRQAGLMLRIVTVALLTSLLVAALVAEGSHATGDVNGDIPAAQLAQDFRPWQAGRGATIALRLSERGEHELARSTMDQLTRWSPGLLGLATERALIDYRAGRATPEDIAATLEVGQDWFGSFNLASEALLEAGEHRVARMILREAIAAHPRYDGWDRGQNEAESYRLLVRSYGLESDCVSARATAATTPDHLALFELDTILAAELDEHCPGNSRR